MLTKASDARTKIGLALAAIVAVAVFNRWVLDARHFFFADDWGWLARAAFVPWQESLHFLPQSIYNDRPGGEAIIRLVYEAAWLKHGVYNQIWLGLHLINCALFFALIAPKVGPYRAFLASVLAGCWHVCISAVWWVGAIFDLAATTFVLLSLLCFSMSGKEGRSRVLWEVGVVLFLFLAFRTKEFATATIVLFVSWIVLFEPNTSRAERVRRLLPSAILTVVFLGIYLWLYKYNGELASKGIYKLSLTPASLMKGVGYYFAFAFYLFAPGSYEPVIGAGVAAAIFVTALAMFNKVGRFSMLAAIALASPILLLGSQHNRLYLYAPHFFIAALLCGFGVKRKLWTFATTLLVAFLIAWPMYSGFKRDSSNFVLIKGEYSKSLFYAYAETMSDVVPPKRMRISVKETYFDPFSWGQGDAVRIYHRDRSIQANVVQIDGAASPCPQETLCLREASGRLVREP